MTDVFKIGKKALTVSVVFTTILWSIGFAALVAPLVVKADVVLAAGDVIQGTSTKNVFYYAADGKRYTFPTDKVFFSWYKDWTVVKKIPDAQLGGITIGGTVAYKAGTQLVKIQTDPKVYAVEPGGTIRWVETEAIATSLYGSAWAKKVHDVDPTIFPYVYKVGTSINTASYPVGALVKVGSDYYYVNAANSKQKVSADVLTANGFQTKFAVTAANLDGYTAGADLAANAALKVVAGTGAAAATTPTTPTTPVAGSGLTVALAADTPVAATVVADTADGAQSLIPALKLNFTAAADGDVKVKTVKLTRGGISADTDVVNMYLYDGATLLAANPSISTKVYTFDNSNGLFTVAKGTSKTVTVKFDLKNAASAGITMNFSIAASSNVVTDGAAVSGSFPIASNTFTGASVTDLGKFTLSNISPTAAANVNAGSEQYEIWRMQAATQDQDVELQKLKITLVGSINVGDVKKFSLWDGATQIGSTIEEMASDKTVTFDLAAAPKLFTKGTTKTLSLKADVIGGSTRTFRATLQSGSDILAYDKGYGVYLKHAGSDTFTVLQPTDGTSGVDYTVSTGTLSVSVATDSPTGNIASSTTAVVLSKFNFVAAGEDIKITQLKVYCTDGSITTKTLKNLKILFDGSQVGSTVATSDPCDGATKALNIFTLGSTVIAKVGKTHVVSIVADITGTTSANETIHADLVVGETNAQRMVSLGTFNTSAATGRTLTIKSNTVTVSLNSSFGNKSLSNPTCAVNAQAIKIGSFVLIAGAGEAADVSQIQLTDITGGTSYLSLTQNVKLMHNNALIASALASPADGSTTAQTHTFNISPVVSIPAGSQYVVDVVGDCKSTTYTTAAGLVKVSAVTASGHETGTSANSSGTTNLQNAYIASAGGLAITVSSDTTLATNLLMGETDKTLAKFQLSASSTEPINITQLVLSSQFTSAATGTLKNIRLYDDAGALLGTISGFDATQTSNTNSTGTYAGAKFTSLSSTVGGATVNYIQVGAGVTKTIIVKADLASYVDLGVTETGQSFKLAMLYDYDGTTSGVQLPVTGTGAQSGVALGVSNTYNVANAGSISWSDTSHTSGNGTSAVATTLLGTNVSGASGPITHGNEFVIYRTKLSIAWDATAYAADGKSSPNAQQQIGKFVVTNTANSGGYAATLDNLNFTISTTLSATAGTTASFNIYKDNLSTTALSTTTFGPAAVAADSAINTAFTQTLETTAGGMTDVEIGAGTSKTFFVILDTSQMTGAAQTTKTLTIQIVTDTTGYYSSATGVKGSAANAYGFVWIDNGVSSNTSGGAAAPIIASDSLLPLSPKSFTYAF